MQFFFILSIGLIMLQTSLFSIMTRKIDDPIITKEANVQLDRYKIFTYVATAYVSQNPFSGGVKESIVWNTLKSVSSLPPALSNISFPDTWTVKRDATHWAICTDIDPSTLSELIKSFPDNNKKIKLSTDGLSTVLGVSDLLEVDAYSLLCQ